MDDSSGRYMGETMIQLSPPSSLREGGEISAGFGFSVEDSDEDPLIGTSLGVYEIESLLGRGGMGRVYLAHHQDLHRPCALKILSPRRIADDQDYVARFLNEGRAAAALIHPHVIVTHAIGQARGLYFLEMEFVPGQSLENLIRDQRRLAPVRATALAAKVAEALAAAHASRIVHRDVKPDNVLVTLHGVPKLADFGLCKRIQRAGETSLPDGLCGTPRYMAPELFAGEAACPRSDVYALGVTYYHMLTGQFPFAGESLQELIRAISTAELPGIRDSIPEVTLEMAECLHLLLDRSPANRPRDGIEAVQLLQAVLGQMEDLDSLLRAAFRDDDRVEWKNEGESFRLMVQLPAGRRQTVHIEASRHAAADRLLLIYSVCCPADTGYYENALRLNSEMPHGSVALREIDGSLKFVVVDTYPRTTVDAEEIRRSAHEVASRADAIEKLLTGLDHH